MNLLNKVYIFLSLVLIPFKF